MTFINPQSRPLAIKDAIRSATICLADITTDNPNVWYELGFAFAAGRPVVMVCSKERPDKRYPFDIQHRPIIPYVADSPSDCETLKQDLTARIKALLTKGETIRQIEQQEQVSPIKGLTQPELYVLAEIAGSIFMPQSPIDNITQDFRYAIRQLGKNPAFACTAICVLALGISAAVAIFSFVEAAPIKRLPYQDRLRLVAEFESSPGTPRSWLSYADFADWKTLNNVFSSIDAYALNGSFTLNANTGAEQVSGTRVSAGFFRTLGVEPVLGRYFRTGEEDPDAQRTVMLSYMAWKKDLVGSQTCWDDLLH
jgi:hypothetical protein